jgi:hypothetical protein
MPKYLIERTLPGAGKLSPADLSAISAKSNAVLRQLGPDIQWRESYVLGDKLFCVYLARDPEIIVEHARCGGFPIDRVMEIKAMMDPSTAERQ